MKGSFDNNGGILTSVIKKKERRSNFNLSHDVKLSLDMGYLVPITVIDTLPGDRFTINTSTMLRMAPLVSPVMHKIDVYIEYFFVPNRITWANWETFITGSRNGKVVPDNDAPAFPVIQPFQNVDFLNGPGTLADYMGLPSETDFPSEELPSDAIRISALPFAAYQRIYDEYYRDENLIESMYDGMDNNYFENYNMLYDGQQLQYAAQQLGAIRIRCWEHDYFTAALPWAQKGEVVSIPVDTSGLSLEYDGSQGPTGYKSSSSTPNFPTGADYPVYMNTSGQDTHGYMVIEDGSVNPGINVDVTANTNIVSSGSGGGTTINDLRAAIKLQEWLETNARGGSRYFESIYAHFGVKSPDSRLQRPEFIGSHRSNMIISEVLQTSSPQGSEDTPQGNMSGHGSSVGTSRNFKYYCQEHGYIIGIMSVMPKTAYQQGIPKHWLKWTDKLDYYFPEFAHLGEQEIAKLEIYAGGTLAEVNEAFGYTPRYAEYKFMNSRVCGDFRDTLKFWHMGRIFDNSPSLNDIFVGADPTKRIFAVQDLPQDSETPTTNPVRDYHSLYAHVFHDIKASRLMPKYGTPITGGI